jgi:hypothetical protein
MDPWDVEIFLSDPDKSFLLLYRERYYMYLLFDFPWLNNAFWTAYNKPHEAAP